MLTNVFLKICGLSLTAGVITLAVLLLRLCFKKAPRWLIAAAWGLVALRLLLPFTIHSPISLLQGADTVTTEQVTVPVVDPREMDFPLNNSILGEQIAPELDGPGMYEDENDDLLPLYDPKEEILKEVEGWYFTGLTEVMGEHGVEYNQITWFCPMGSPLPYGRTFIQLIRMQGSTLHVTPLYRAYD